MPYFSTRKFFTDQYAAFYETELIEKPEIDPAKIEFLKYQAKKRRS
jgi:hypothetical protein